MPDFSPGQSTRIPLSTYRLQLHAGLTFRQAADLVDYLAELGIDFVYTSPILMARPGSEHGYDVVDPTRLNPEIGTQAEFDQLCERLAERGMGLLVDIVPNHMAAHESNPYWCDVLENGQASRFAHYFDIDWEAGEGKLLLPALGDEPSAVLDRGELEVEHEDGRAWLRYFDARFPLQGAERSGPELSVAELRALLAKQHYELRRWNGDRPVNYRRFFSISELVGVRVEDPDVFQHTHELILRLIKERKVTGLRIDHPDGLLNPAEYCVRLQAACRRQLTGDVEAPPGERTFYVVIEKILTGNEQVREDWPVHGPTGYQQMNTLGGVFVDRGNGAALRALYERFTRSTRRFVEVLRESKRCVLDGSLEPEMLATANRLLRLISSQPGGDVFELSAVREVLREVIACFPVYRTYVTPTSTSVTGEDRAITEQALDTARASSPELPESILTLLRSVLLLEPPMVRDEGTLAACRDFSLRFQQLTGPAAAKGVEDTAFYRYVPLLSLNEVGGEPDEFGLSLEDYHARNAERLRRYPQALSATSTHDTKRSEDVRSRLAALSELPQEWGEALERWQTANAWAKQTAAAISAPDANDEYLLYQTLVGVWPLEGRAAATDPVFRERIRTYMLKAIREAKRFTRWIDPNADYERVVCEFVDSILDPERSAAFLDDIDAFQVRLSRAGMFSSLSLVVIKIGGPGVPDFYQGSELWDLSLVDPDNRRPVDYRIRRELLSTLTSAPVNTSFRELLHSPEDGRLKLLATTRGLQLRKRCAALFREGDYVPTLAEGPRADQVVAFTRSAGPQAAVVVAGRFYTRFGDVLPVAKAWAGTRLTLPDDLPPGRYRDVFTAREFEVSKGMLTRLDVSTVLHDLPVAMLERVM